MRKLILSMAAVLFGVISQADACTRVLYETGTGTHIVGRNIDWNDVKAQTSLWVFPKYKDRKVAVAAVFSQMRSVSVPLGMSDPNHPNISSTLWRTVADHDAKRYYFDSAVMPAVFWVDLAKVNLKEGAAPMEIKMTRGVALAVLAVTLAGPLAVAQEYDLVINNGRVIDPETKLDSVRHVGI